MPIELEDPVLMVAATKLLKLWPPWRNRMDVHENARLTPAGREMMVCRVVEGGQTPQAVSQAVGVASEPPRQ